MRGEESDQPFADPLDRGGASWLNESAGALTAGEARMTVHFMNGVRTRLTVRGRKYHQSRWE